MAELLIPISKDEFESKINIKFKNILDGFSNFKNFMITANNVTDGENKLIQFIERVFEYNNSEGYVDFYINKISAGDKKRLIALTSDEDKDILKLHLNAPPHNGAFYKLKNKSLIPFLVRLCTNEIFFITFYFANNPITIWGNYDMKFPCFFNNQKDLEFYYKTCKSFGFFE